MAESKGFPVHTCKPDDPCPVLIGVCMGADKTKWKDPSWLKEEIMAKSEGLKKVTKADTDKALNTLLASAREWLDIVEEMSIDDTQPGATSRLRQAIDQAEEVL